MKKHVLWMDEIDEIDEIDDSRQLCMVWCQTHQKYEQHWLPQDRMNSDEEYVVYAKG